MEKGVCVNGPRKGAKSDYGLKFAGGEPGSGGAGPDERKDQGVRGRGPARGFAFDFGAWGTLNITAKDEQGRDLKVRRARPG